MNEKEKTLNEELKKESSKQYEQNLNFFGNGMFKDNFEN